MVLNCLQLCRVLFHVLYEILMHYVSWILFTLFSPLFFAVLFLISSWKMIIYILKKGVYGRLVLLTFLTSTKTNVLSFLISSC